MVGRPCDEYNSLRRTFSVFTVSADIFLKIFLTNGTRMKSLLNTVSGSTADICWQQKTLPWWGDWQKCQDARKKIKNARDVCTWFPKTPLFKFPDFSLIKIKFLWPKKCKRAGLVETTSSTQSVNSDNFNKFSFIKGKYHWDHSNTNVSSSPTSCK